MTGTGTQADPYICDTWAELISVSTSKDTYIQMSGRGSKIIDFNGIQPLGFDSQVNLSGQIDFNGWTFKNFYSKSLRAVYILNGSSWDNLTFDNFYQEVATSASGNVGFLYADSNSYAVKITNCKFYGKVSYGAYSTSSAIVFYSSNARTMQFEQCAFSLECSCTSGKFALFRMGFIRDCNIKFDVKSVTANIVALHNASELYIFNSLITGKINVSDTTGTILSGASLSGYNVFSVQTNVPMVYAGAGVSVFDNNLSPVTVSTDNFVGCTSSELKSASHLYSVGFPCYR